ncbi:MAG: hypothetical protein IKV15_03290 [Bacteroidaceae bacterium]|nr:hypothetical protein [Bacteroidaceae bacterium]
MNRTTLTIIMLLFLAITTARSNAQEATDTKQLQEIVVMGGKHKTLSNRGTRILGAIHMLTPDKVGYEEGSALKVKHPFEVEEIEFFIISNSIKDVTLQIAIYRDSTFTEVLSQPIFVNIPEGNRQTVVAKTTERILLQPGDYIVSIGLADCNGETQQQWANSDQWDGQTRYQMMTKQSLQFPLYFKAGQIRSNPDDAFEKCPTNIGIRVRGIAARQ